MILWGRPGPIEITNATAAETVTAWWVAGPAAGMPRPHHPDAFLRDIGPHGPLLWPTSEHVARSAGYMGA